MVASLRSQSSLEMLPASLGSSAAIAATGCAASFALIGLTSRCFVPQFAIVALLRYRLQVSRLSVQHGRSASSHRPALTLARCSVAAHCALLRVLATPALRASAVRGARLRCSLPYWGLRTGLRFAGPVFRGCGALRAVLAPPPLRGFDGCGLFRPQGARFVRPLCEKGAF